MKDGEGSGEGGEHREETFFGFMTTASVENQIVQCFACKGVFIIQIDDAGKLNCCPFCQRLWVAREVVQK